ncbi:MAG TPA: hypothetical protein VMZ28_15165 [Kofleriaceae bacterium]|nr:hypothetical protein [Kofleriaceae bacterium]
MKPLLTVGAFVVASLLAVSARAEETEVSFAYVPAPNAEAIVIDQPMGKLVLNGWDKPEVRIVARKRAKNGATLDRLKVNVEMSEGRIRVRTGVRVGDSFRSLPPARADSVSDPMAPMAIDLTIDAPRRAQVRATTWSGDLQASGFRAGAELASSGGGDVRANDIEGKVVTHALKGRQSLSAIRGDVLAAGESGDVDFDTIDGEVLEARVVEGTITGKGVRTQVVRLFSTAGGIVLVGSLRAGSRYELTALDGDVSLKLKRAPFSVTANAGGRGQVKSGFTLAGQVTPSHLEADHQGGGASLVLTAANGNVLLDPY